LAVLGESSAEVLALRQKLLRLRNTAPPAAPASPAKAAPIVSSPPAKSSSSVNISTSSSSEATTSDSKKEQGNKAMADKQYELAVQLYSAALSIDASNMAAMNNRALGFLKLERFEEAESDASAVLDFRPNSSSASDSASAAADHRGLRLKALCRRAQARRAIADAFMASSASAPSPSSSLSSSTPGLPGLGPRAKAVLNAQDKYREAAQDLLQLLKQDPANKTALVEQRLVKDALKRCHDQQAPLTTLSKQQAATAVASSTPTPTPSGGNAPATPVPAPAPRANMQAVSSMFSPSASSASSAPKKQQELDAFGLVARSSKKFNTSTAPSATDDSNSTTGQAAAAAAVAAPSAPSTPLAAAAAAAAGGSNSSTAKKGKAAAGTPATPVVMTASPTEPPKTVYE
jgi:tetratricopeptide (TPR) repeat protein